MMKLPEINIEDLFKAYPQTHKIILTNDYICGNELLKSLARHGLQWMNCRVLSPVQWIQEQVPSWAVYSILTQDVKHLLMDHVIREGLESEALTYFSRLKEPEGMISAMTSFVDLMNGLNLEQGKVAAEWFLNPDKGKDLLWIWSRYSALIQEDNHWDNHLLIRHFLDEGPLPSEDKENTIYLFLNAENFSRTEEMLLKRLPEQNMYKVVFNPYVEKPVLTLCSSQNPEMEMRDIFKQIEDRKCPYDTVEIILTDLAVYTTHLYHYSQSYHIPMTFQQGIPLKVTRVGVALYRLMKWLLSGGHSLDLSEMLSLQYLVFSSKLAKPVRDLRRSVWSVSPETLAVQEDSGLASEMQSLFEKFIKPARKLLKGKRSFFSMKRDVLKFITASLDVLEEERACFEEVCEYLERGMPSAMEFPSVLILKRLAEVFESQWVLCQTSKPGSLHVSSYLKPSLVFREHVFVPGLSVECVPGKMKSSSLILDVEKNKLSSWIKTRRQESKERFEMIRNVLDLSCRSLSLSYAKAATGPDSEEALPSPVLLEAYRRQQGNPELSWENFYEGITGSAGYLSTEDSIKDFSWQQESCLRRGHQALQAHESPEFSIYDGLVGDLIHGWDPRLNEGRTLSSSSLETLAACPLRFLLSYIMKLDSAYEEDRDKEIQINALYKGTLIHSIYFEFFQSLKSRDKLLSPEDKPLFDEIVEKHLKDISQERFKEELKFSLDSFFLRELERKERVPRYFEVNFGAAKSENCGDLQHKDPVKIALKEGSLALSGSIDRVDQAADGSFYVLDYKTGTGSWLKEGDCFKNGKQLQAHLYARALVQILKNTGLEASPRVAFSGYYFATLEAAFKEHFLKPDQEETLRELLSALLNIIREGSCVVMRGNDAKTGLCRSCSYKTVCDVYQEGALERKYAHSGSAQQLSAVFEVLDKRFK